MGGTTSRKAVFSYLHNIMSTRLVIDIHTRNTWLQPAQAFLTNALQADDRKERTRISKALRAARKRSPVVGRCAQQLNAISKRANKLTPKGLHPAIDIKRSPFHNPDGSLTAEVQSILAVLEPLDALYAASQCLPEHDREQFDPIMFDFIEAQNPDLFDVP